MVMIMYLDHIAVTVKDMDRAVEFYTEKLGFSVIRKLETATQNVVYVANGLTQLELFALKMGNAKEVPPLKEEEVGLKHIAFHVDDIQTVVDDLKNKGVEFTSELTKLGGNRYVIWFKDPDGTLLQLLQG